MSPTEVLPFVDACLMSPVGVSLVAQLEWRARPEFTRITDDPTPHGDAVRVAVERVHTMTFGELCAEAIEAAETVGPWISGAEENAWAAYLHADGRRPLAQAIADVFGDDLHAPISLDDQQWWLHPQGAAAVAPLFENLDRVYENGELSWAAVRAYGPSPVELLECGDGEAPGPATRWHMPVIEPVRVFEIHRPDDWHQLCNTYPLPATTIHGSWALPGPNAGRYKPLLALPNQHAATTQIATHLCPKWSAVARDFDAVHLSWAGFITAEGHILTGGGTTTMLRYWVREVTMWLNDHFGTPSPLTAPIDCYQVIDPRTSAARLHHDAEVIENCLGRAPDQT